ncbi:heavy-metal-associated domain-containing protein [Candidatus Microgenomates bacterium]|nr:heavy-metal-associated domain-containing protein [Candidatus Microgenomates bacterium]
MSTKVHKVYKVDGMHCPSCAMTIEWELEDRGVKAKCSYAKQLVEVEFEPEKVSDEEIKEVVAKSGYRIIGPVA